MSFSGVLCSNGMTLVNCLPFEFVPAMEEVSLFERMSMTCLSSLMREIIQIDHRNVTDSPKKSDAILGSVAAVDRNELRANNYKGLLRTFRVYFKVYVKRHLAVFGIILSKTIFNHISVYLGNATNFWK